MKQISTFNSTHKTFFVVFLLFDHPSSPRHKHLSVWEMN